MHVAHEFDRRADDLVAYARPTHTGPDPRSDPGECHAHGPGPRSYPRGVPPDDGPTLNTERLILRRWLARDREPFARMNADPEVTRHLSRALNRDESDAFVDRIEAQVRERGFGLWAVERRDDRRFLGFTGLAAGVAGAPTPDAIEIGWRFDRFAWGHGYATEAARAALRFGFEVACLPEIVSLTSVGHEASRRVMERIGLHRDPADDFDHPRLAVDSPLRRHVLYRLTSEEYRRAADSPGTD